MKRSPVPYHTDHRSGKNHMRQHQIQPKIQMWQSHNNSIIRKEQGQQHARPNGTIILLLLTPYNHPSALFFGKIPSNTNNSSQYSSNLTNRSSTSTILSSQTASFCSKSCNFNSNVAYRSHDADR